MAASPLNPKTLYHSRSISIPSRLHPLVPQFEEHLCRLKAFESTSSSSSAISHKLSGLKDLHDFVNNTLLLLPLTQQALPQQCHEKWVDELLDGSLRLLDVCIGAKDALLQTKEQVHKLQSILRRRRRAEFGLASEFEEYLSSRKKVKAAIHKAVKGMEFKCTNKDHVSFTTVSMLREVEEITLTMFESFLLFIEGPKSSSWSLVSKLVHPKRVACDDEETERNELEMVDAALHSLIRHKTSKADNITSVEIVQNKLGKLELSIQDLEAGLECLFKSLIKTRVSLLNIFNH